MTQENTAQDARNGNGEPRKPHQRILKSKGFIPTVVVFALIFLVLFSSRLAGRPPQIDSITPESGKPGDVMIITGRYFGPERDGEVRISGISPTSGEYVEWTDTTISVVIPDEASSGLVYVITKNGRSRGLLFANNEQIPVPVAGTSKPGEPSIDSIQPNAARIGETITITGKNFGLEKGGSDVYFTWAAGSKSDSGNTFDPASLVAAGDYDFDYVSWSDIEIVLHVPDGATSGNLFVTSDKGRSNSRYFEVLGGAGLKYFSKPRKYSVQYGLSVDNVIASGDNCLYAWMPLILSTPEQRKVQLVSQEPEPMLGNHNGAALFSLADLTKGGKYEISESYIFDRYMMETQVTPAKVPLTYDTGTELYKYFTAPDPDVSSTNSEILKALPGVLQSEKNPYLKAKRIYDYLLAQLSYSPTAGGTDPVSALRSKQGNAFDYSSLTCAFLRAAGIPARMISGYLAGYSGQPTRRHFWDEFYIQTLGWFPLDPLLGDEPSLSPTPLDSDVDAKSYYFGKLDNWHITFSKGLEVVSQMNPAGKVKRDRQLPFLFTIHDEAVGGITSFIATFKDLEVSGTY
jgi:hypothetical protein